MTRDLHITHCGAAALAVVAALAGPASAAAQNPACLPPERAAQLHADAVRILSSDNQGSKSTRYIFHLPHIPASRIRIMSDSATCHHAAVWYATRAESAVTGSTPVAVVQADTLLFVEPTTTAGRRGCCWVVMVFSLAGVEVYSYGAGQ